MLRMSEVEYYIGLHKYTRGQYKGHAPVYEDRRRRTRQRYIRLDENTIAARMYNTNCVTWRRTPNPEGGDPIVRITVDCNGWAGHRTTREFLEQVGFNVYTNACRETIIYPSLTNACRETIIYPSLTAAGGLHMYAYYDGMVFDERGQLVSTPIPYKAKVCDTEAVEKALEKNWVDIINSIEIAAATRQPHNHNVLGKLRRASRATVLANADKIMEELLWHGADCPALVRDFLYNHLAYYTTEERT